MKSVEQRAILDKYVASSAEEKTFLEKKYDFCSSIIQKNCQLLHLDMVKNNWKIWQMTLQVRTMSKIKLNIVPTVMLLLRRMRVATRYEMNVFDSF